MSGTNEQFDQSLNMYEITDPNVLREINLLPFKVSIKVNSSIASPYSIYDRNNSSIVLKTFPLDKDPWLLHEVLHLKMRVLGYAFLKFDKRLHQRHRDCFSRVHSTFEHVIYVYPSLKALGYTSYDEPETERVTIDILSKKDTDIYGDMLWMVLLVCCVFESERQELKEKIARRVLGFPSEAKTFFEVLLNMIGRGVARIAVRERNNVLTDMVTFLSQTSRATGKVSVFLPRMT